MRISILQTDIVWENKQENLRRLHEKLETLRGTTEIVVLPETFSTGFSMNTASLAEPTTGETITTLRRWSEEYRLALAGSFIANETAPEGGKAILLQPCILPYARRRCLLLRQTAPLPDGARNRAFHFRLPTSHYPVSRLEHTVACML